MQQIVKNEGSLFVKEIEGMMKSGAVKIVGQNPDVVEPETIPYKYTIVVGVGLTLYGRIFSVFIDRHIVGEGEIDKFETIYFSCDWKYVDENIEKILAEIIRPDYYYETTMTERRDNYGRMQSISDTKFVNLK